jgi:hypothetical protein
MNMDDTTNIQAVVFEIVYDAGTYSDEDGAVLKQDFSEFGSVRVRPYNGVAAGWGVDIMLVISFIGGIAVTHLIEQITEKLFDNIVAKIKEFYRPRRVAGIRFPRTITLSYDDIDITMHLISDESLDNLPKLLAAIHKELLANPSKDRVIHRITVPMEKQDGRWQEISHDRGFELDAENLIATGV